MKKFILLFSLIFCAFNSKIHAQTIDSVAITQVIECPGGQGDFTVYTSLGLVDYNIVLQKLDAQFNFQSHKVGQWVNSTQTTVATFSNLSSGVYRILLVNENCSPPYQAGFNLTTPDSCIYDDYVEIRMIDPQPLTYNIVPASLDCWYDTTADLEVVNIDGYTRPYNLVLQDVNGTVLSTITLGPSADNHTFTGLSAGDYTITVTDFYNCPAVTAQETITANDTIIPDITVVDSISCYQASDGVLEASVVSGGTAPYNFYWIEVSSGDTIQFDTTTTLTTNQVDQLGPGSYYCIIVDDLNCDTVTDIVTLIEPTMLAGESLVTQIINCKDDCTGEIIVSIDPLAPGAGGPYNYELRDSVTGNLVATNTTGIFSNLCADDSVTYYQVTIFDRDNCDTVLNSVPINEPDSITFDTLITDIVCTGDCNGRVELLNFTGGNLPTYGISRVYYTDPQGFVYDRTVNETIIDSNLCAGTYTYMVKDSLNCESPVYTVTLLDPPLFEIVASNALLYSNNTNVSCPGINDAEFDVQPVNAASSAIGGLVQYFVNGNAIADTVAAAPNLVRIDEQFGDLSNNGVTTIQAIDANGCVADTFISLSEPTLFEVTLTTTPQNCAINNGSIFSSTIGGVSPFSYVITGPTGQSTTVLDDTITFQGLSTGNYNVTITDALSCVASSSIFVDSTYIDVTTQAYSRCNDSAGVIVLSTNGVQVNIITWLDNNLNPIRILSDTVNYLPVTTDTLFGLSAGTYYYQVQRNGCSVDNPTPVTIGPNLTVDATIDMTQSVTQLSCFGDLTNDIWIDVNDNFLASGVSNSFINAYNYIILQNGIASLQSSNPVYNVLANSGGLPAGSYDIVVIPDSSIGVLTCIDTVSVTITQPNPISVTLGSTDVTCFGDSSGTVSVLSISGGNVGSYNYVWTDSQGNFVGGTSTINNLSAGWYILTVTDALNCPAPANAIDSIEVLQPSDIIVNLTVTAIDSCAASSGSSGNNSIGEFDIQANGGTPYTNNIYDYIWWPSGNFSANINGTITGNLGSVGTLSAGTYVVRVLDSLGCIEEDTVTINEGLNPVLDPSSFNNISCNGLSDGSYTAIIDSVNGSQSYPYLYYNFNLTPPAFVSGYSPSGSGFSAGDTITIRVKDNFGCVDDIVHVFTEPDSLIIQNISSSTFPGGANISCFGQLDGSLMIDSVTGGTLPYYYSINGTPGPIANGFYNNDSTDHLFDSLAAAWYYTDVIDANGCTYRDSIILTQPDSLLIDSFATSIYIGGWGVSCHGFSDGSSFGYVSGGTYDSVLYNYSYTWTNNTDTLSLSDTVNNIQANEWYILHIQDINGCSTFDSIQLTEPTPLQIDSFTINNVICVGGDRGNATVWVSGATPGYTYSWNNGDTISPTYVNPNDTVGSNNDTTALADTLRAGHYVVEIHDANGCHISDTITISEPTISVEIDSLVITQITCYNYNNGSVDIVATGPEPLPYLYTIYDPSTPSIITAQGNLGFNQGLSPGNYVAHVQDGIGCIDRDTFEIFDVDSVYIVNVQWENLSCHGFDDGYVWDIVATGGTWPYEYSIDGSSTRYPSWLCNNQNPSCPTGYVFTGLDPGVHTIEIYDSNNCANSYAFTVTEPSPMQFAVSTNNYNNYQILCDGDLDTAFIVVSGGDPIYTIILDGDSLNSNTTLSTYEWPNINEGWHLFEIFDANNCLVDTNIYFAAPDPITAANSTITEVLCEGACTGAINAVISGGVGQGIGTNYQYQWYEGTSTVGTIIGTSFAIQNLCIDPIDSYSLNVIDDNGCQANFSWSIGSNVLTIDSIATVFTSVEPSCNGYCDGTITIVVSGGDSSQVVGQAPYYYQWDDVLSQTTETAIGLCAGTYSCTVTDMAGCVVTKEFVLDQPDTLNVTIDLIEPVSCNGSSDGELRAVPTGGTSPYDFIWSQGTILNNQLTSTVNGLAPAVYSVFVEDDNGCTDTAHYDLTEPQQLDIPLANILISDVKCYGGSTGTIEVTATGGTLIPGIPGTYEYVLLDENDNVISSVINNPSADFSGLIVGIYKVEVTDYFGCSYVTGDIYVDQPNEPLSVILDGSNGTCDNSASLLVYISGGTSDYSYTFNNVNGNTSGITSPTGSGNSGITFVEVPDVGLADFSVLVIDKNGCTIDASTRVRGYENIFLPNNSNTFSDIICQGGLIQIPVEECDGCMYFWTRSQDTIANTSSLEIFSDISWLPIEILTLNITDENGCVTSIDVTIEKDDVNAAATVSPDNNVAPGSTITLSSSASFSEYLWTNEFGDTLSTEREFMYDDITQSTWFWVYVENANGCKDYDSLYVVVGSQPVDAFSPNGDGFNDYWFVEDIDQFSGNKVQIYNRWGELIFEDSCSPNCWDGKIDGKDAPIGAYYYIIDHNDGTELLKGSITLIR